MKIELRKQVIISAIDSSSSFANNKKRPSMKIANITNFSIAGTEISCNTKGNSFDLSHPLKSEI